MKYQITGLYQFYTYQTLMAGIPHDKTNQFVFEDSFSLARRAFGTASLSCYMVKPKYALDPAKDQIVKSYNKVKNEVVTRLKVYKRLPQVCTIIEILFKKGRCVFIWYQHADIGTISKKHLEKVVKDASSGKCRFADVY